MRKKALVLLTDRLLVNIMRTILESVGFDVIQAETPKEAVSFVGSEKYNVVFIGRHEGTVVKNKLADIIYEKALSPKPHIVIMREPGDLVHRDVHVSVIKHPTFHHEVLESVASVDGRPGDVPQFSRSELADSFIRFKHFVKLDIVKLFRNLKGNRKFEIRAEGKRVVGFTMNGEIYVLYSDLDDPYSLINFSILEMATEEMKIAEFLSLQLGPDVFKVGIKEFVFKSFEKVSQRERLLSFIPSEESRIEVKAPKYVLNQCYFIKSNFDVDWLESKSGRITVAEATKNSQDLSRLRAIVAMYVLGMIELTTEEQEVKTKFDVKIRKSFLKKIIDKIRGL